MKSAPEREPSDILAMLHKLNAVSEENMSLWHVQPDLFPVTPDVHAQTEYSAGEIPIGDKMIKITMLASRDIGNTSLSVHVDKNALIGMVRALQRLATRQEGVFALEEITISLHQPKNPNTGESANGISPTTYLPHETDERYIEPMHSGTIILFPAAFSTDPFRGSIADVPHIEGVLTHESAHQFVAYNEIPLAEQWRRATGWEGTDEPGEFANTSPSEFPTLYAAVSPPEDFAESYALYVCAPERLKEISRRRYDFFEKTSLTQEDE
ncbi:MAG: hypothetical protein COV60_00770 [Candidatus Magasanikbacteria bacterium CG11_big_fil_rev_8_21_14_0_20_43_7]|uniref:Uncharacterized protein n=1 Tax=Candidatus Magasanikbacteria bacterium CG11_big_fil_rev_8_21_14_0_20_43_7 TaxID=1974654 RepID=A0A2H0N387_9BACT|nr:MAG: hypothetical protein COV60_00770 [Candidatus Magasanikbacteria bacterium CG11_big_fil_rev_8_21_14_0_20_43_7]